MKKLLFILLTTLMGLPVARAQAPTVKEVVKINPTTAEVRYANGKRLTVDFYGPNIVRLFRDDNPLQPATSTLR